MSSIGDRLRSERERLGASQSEFAEGAGSTRKSQFNYETDARRPDADYLAAIAAMGVDVLFVLTEKRSGQTPALTADEQTMLSYYREASKEVRRAALGALLGAAPAHTPPTQIGGANSQHSSGAGAVNIGSFGSTPTTSKRRK